MSKKNQPLSAPKENYEFIDPSEMSQLRVIAYLASRGSEKYAKDVAGAVTSQPAIDVANVLIKGDRPNSKPVADLARQLRLSVAIPPRTVEQTRRVPGRPR